ncbi:MAG: hypothetical protein ACRDUS_20515 [Mycobacterium sp.]
MLHTIEQVHALAAACEQLRGSEAPGGYRAYRRGQSGEPVTDGTAELLKTFDELDGPDGWAEKIGTRNRTSTRNGVLKAEAIQGAASVLAAEGIDTTAAVRDVADDKQRLAQVRRAWCAVTGQTSGVTWRYVDRASRRFHRAGPPCDSAATAHLKGEGTSSGGREREVMVMELFWMLDESTAATAGQRSAASETGLAARIEDDIYLVCRPSVLRKRIEDAVTLALVVRGDVTEEIGRYPSYDAARAAAQDWVDGLGGQVSGGASR